MAKKGMEELHRLTVDGFKNTQKNPFVVLLDDVRSLHNVGSIFRTCDAFLAQRLYLCGITGQPPDREIHKTALGATESVDWEYASDVVTLAARLRSEGYTLTVIEQANPAVSLQHFEPQGPVAFVFGNEVFGVKEALLEMADVVVEVPQFGTKHSLNIAVSVGIVLWDFVSKRMHV